MGRRVSLPVLREPAPAPRLRASRAGWWRAGVLLAVHLAIAAHLAHWLIAGRTMTPLEPSEAMAYGQAGIVNAGLIFFAAAILLTALFGRWFCGWGCHLVALQDGALWLLGKLGVRPRPLRSRLLVLVPALAFVYMFLWPAGWRLWRGESLAVRGYELTTSHLWATFPGWVIGGLTFVVCGFVAVYFLGAKGFCTYACPYGAAFAWADRLAPLRIRVTDACQGCGHCTAVCTSNVRVHEEVRTFGMVVDPGCMKCRDCVSVCPNDALYVGFGRLPPLFARARGPASEPRRYPLSWGEEALLGVAFLASFLAWRGLFGRIPFLMALGLAGCLAFLALLGWRLLRRRDFAFRHRPLRRSGRLTVAGRWAVVGLLAVAIATGYASVLQLVIARAQAAFGELGGVRARALDPSLAEVRPTRAEEEALARAAAGFERVARWAIVPWLGIDGRLAWARFLRDDPTGFAVAADRAVAAGDAVEELAVLATRAALSRGDATATVAALERLTAAQATRGGAGNEATWLQFGRLAVEAGRASVAAAVFERALGRFGDSPTVLYNAAVFAALQGNVQLAADRFRRTLALDPEHREARENLAGMLASLGSYGEAVALYGEAIRRAPQDVALRVLLARALVAAGDVGAARSEIDVALSLAPDDASALALREQLSAVLPRPEGNLNDE